MTPFIEHMRDHFPTYAGLVILYLAILRQGHRMDLGFKNVEPKFKDVESNFQRVWVAIAALRIELKAEIEAVRSELKTEFKSEIGELRTEVREGFLKRDHRLEKYETRIESLEQDRKSKSA